MEKEKKQTVLIPTNDYVFARIFGRVGNEKITKSLISSVIKDEVESISLNETPILERDLIDDKMGILDIKAKVNKEITIDIEMQVVRQNNIEERLMFYWSRAYTNEIKKGQDYNKLKRTIVILFADFKLNRLIEIPKYHTRWHIYEDEYKDVILTNDFEINIIEIPKVIEQAQNQEKGTSENKLLVWLHFIQNPDEVKEMEEIEEIKLAKEELEKIRQDKTAKRIAELREKYIMEVKSSESYGYDKGIEEGEKAGAKKEKIEIAKKLLNSGMSIEKIQEIVELTEQEITNLK